jgi:hypothetical protein
VKTLREQDANVVVARTCQNTAEDRELARYVVEVRIGGAHLDPARSYPAAIGSRPTRMSRRRERWRQRPKGASRRVEPGGGGATTRRGAPAHAIARPATQRHAAPRCGQRGADVDAFFNSHLS